MSTLSSYGNVINEIIDAIFLTSWKYYFFYTELIFIVVNMSFFFRQKVGITIIINFPSYIIEIWY